MLYDIGFAIFSIFYLPTLIFKGKLHGDFLERFGVYDEEKAKALKASRGAIWIQAVSVGEVALCRRLVPLLKAKAPRKKIIFSTITKTGNDLAKKLFADDAIVIYFPLDFSFVVKKVMILIQPSLYVMVETEVWPNFLKATGRYGIPSVMINGRISDRSFGKYKLARPFLRGILKGVRFFCMQTDIDAIRIKAMGAPAGRVSVTGNMKFDVQPKSAQADADEIRRKFGLTPDGELFVAGSTHKGEEEAVVGAFKKLLGKFPGLKLLIAPRHIQRAGEVSAVVKKFGFEPILLSGSGAARTAPVARQVYILDTIGHLRDFYSIATVVFVGGSLVRHGGQNPLEPAANGKPVVFGPHMFNFKDITALLLKSDAAIQVAGHASLLSAVDDLLADKVMRQALGARAKKVVFDNRGATERNIEILCANLSTL
ncbi:MAG: 3-deoxy-D-manno-octulosonic acid transferase [Candidatus Omnitrophica bacterium]|nr:3-deoxy-D-manno-octulosonic acid transferase [Candidatus Omnitrophota bacterium]